MVITVDKVEVLNDVRRKVEYIGSKSGKWDTLRIISGDEELLYRWLTEALGNIETILQEICRVSRSAGFTWSIETVHKNHRDGMASSIANSYVEESVVSEWLSLFDREQADYYKSKSLEKLQELRRIAYYKDL